MNKVEYKALRRLARDNGGHYVSKRVPAWVPIFALASKRDELAERQGFATTTRKPFMLHLVTGQAKRYHRTLITTKGSRNGRA